MAKNKSSVPGPMSTSVSNVEVVAAEAEYYDDNPEELAIWGSMEFEVLPANQPERSKKVKPYDRPVEKKVVEKTVPKVLSHPKGTQPNKAYVELPPTILKCT